MISNNPKKKDPEERFSPKINPFKEHAQEKMSPFKELPKPRPQLETDKPSENRPPKEITIKIKPWKMARGLLIILVLAGVFFLGRWSAGGDSFTLPDFSNYFSHQAGPSGLVTGDTQVNGSVTENSTATALVENETKPAEINASEEAKGPETVVTESYSKVSLSLDGVYKDWKGSWGKIKGVKYTIINNEAGTIKPNHFVMTVEGYDDGEKFFDVSYTSQKVKAGQTLSDEAAVSGGFAYSAVSLPDGDLSKVKISLFLVDEDGVTMASAQQDVNLEGNQTG